MWQRIQNFIHEVRQFSNAAARDRFRQNLGTPVCENCDGLKAGPGVAATCFQRKQCFYTNWKATDVTASQHGLIDRLYK